MFRLFRLETKKRSSRKFEELQEFENRSQESEEPELRRVLWASGEPFSKKVGLGVFLTARLLDSGS